MEATQMKALRFISTILGTSAMFFFFCISTPVLRAQEEHQQDAKPAEGQAHDQETKPTEESAKPTPSKPTKAEPKDEKRPEDSKAPKENARDNNNRQSQTETRTQTESKNSRVQNGRIPDADFHAHFGSGHHFHVGHPQVVNGQSRFQYGGYTFTFVEAWPAGWGYDDDFYIDFIDGQYYLIDLRHPEVRLALVVVL
jgi:hypothetical protein